MPMKFSELKLNNKIIELLCNKGITNPTEIQSQTYALCANGHDVIGISETGSGKTLAFLLPTVNQFILSEKTFHTLIITPTRELALQISEELNIFLPLGIRYATLIGGEMFSPQVESINKHPHIVIGTPGRIAKHILKNKNFKISRFRKLILDEADRFFENDFVSDLDLIAAKLEHKNQTLMFTATSTDKVEKLSKIFMKNPRIIGNNKVYEKVQTLEEFYIFIPEKYKITVLKYFLKKNEGGTIVFVNMAINAERLVLFLKRYGYKCEGLYGAMPQTRRDDIIKRFRKFDFNILIATDLASRGLDISGIDKVINYELPTTAKDYIHRVGRTARSGKKGTAFSFVTQYDVPTFQKLEFLLKRKLVEFNINASKDNTNNGSENYINDTKELENNNSIYEGFREDNQIYEDICSELNKIEVVKKTKK